MENENKDSVTPKGENPDLKLPEGFRIVEDGEVIPPGYTIHTDIALEKTITDAPKVGTAAPAQKFAEPKVMEVIIDPKQPQKEAPTQFNFTNPNVIKQAQAQPTKGDQSKKETPASSDEKLTDAEKLKQLDETIRKEDELEAKVSGGYSDFHDTAEMAVEGYEGLVQLFGMWYSKDFNSASTYAFLKEKKEKLVYLGTKISRRRNWVLKPEYLFINNLITETTRSVMKAKGNRNLYMEQRRKEEEENIVPERNKGGPNKGEIKTRGPGRPSKADKAKE